MYGVIKTVAETYMDEGDQGLRHSLDVKTLPTYDAAVAYVSKLYLEYSREQDEDGNPMENEDPNLAEEDIFYNSEPGHEADIIAFNLSFDFGTDCKSSVIVKMTQNMKKED